MFLVLKNKYFKLILVLLFLSAKFGKDGIILPRSEADLIMYTFYYEVASLKEQSQDISHEALGLRRGLVLLP